MAILAFGLEIHPAEHVGHQPEVEMGIDALEATVATGGREAAFGVAREADGADKGLEIGIGDIFMVAGNVHKIIAASSCPLSAATPATAWPMLMSCRYWQQRCSTLIRWPAAVVPDESTIGSSPTNSGITAIMSLKLASSPRGGHPP